MIPKTSDENVKNENIKAEAENKKSNENKQKTENDKEILISGVTLSNTRINITFSDMNESNISNDPLKRSKSIPFKSDNLDLDIPNFSPPKYKKNGWKLSHSCSYILFVVFYPISTAFIYQRDSSKYDILLRVSHISFIIATLVEWFYFKKGCIGESNLNSKLKKNVDQSWKAKILRAEYGIIYFISFLAACILLTGDLILYFSDSINLSFRDIKIIIKYFNLFGMMTLALSQIMKINKLLNLENKISYIKTDFSKSLFEIIFFFASLLDGGTILIEIYNINLKDSPLYIFHLIIKIVVGISFFISGIILQFNYFFSEYCRFN